jgi:hypothetical protein
VRLIEFEIRPALRPAFLLDDLHDADFVLHSRLFTKADPGQIREAVLEFPRRLIVKADQI